MVFLPDADPNRGKTGGDLSLTLQPRLFAGLCTIANTYEIGEEGGGRGGGGVSDSRRRTLNDRN